MPILWIVASSVFLLLLYKTVNILRNIQLARATGLPYVITPFLETEVVSLAATPVLRYIYQDYLDEGKGWPTWCRFIIKDWQWEDKRLIHDELGEVFLCVSPEGIICYSADAAMGWDVMNRRYDFIKPPDKYKLLEVYGPNVLTAEGAIYRYHIRITAPPFKDMTGVNELVWNETLYQTRRITEAWSKETSRDLYTDVNALTLCVMSLAGFGKRIDWTPASEQDVPKGYKLSFLKALRDTTEYIVAILLFPSWLLSMTPLRVAHHSHRQLEKYLREMIRNERQRLDNKQGTSLSAQSNLLSAVMQASRLDAQTGNQSGRKESFTEDEVMGNIFIYLLAGYETTANAIIYALMTLALRQDIQDEVIEEIDNVYSKAKEQGRTELSYSEDFQSLHYTFGFMYETFRLFPGVILITKMTTKPQPIYVMDSFTSNTRTHILPAGTRVYLSSPGVHYNPKYWPDPYKLDPHRWDIVPSVRKTDNDVPEEKRVLAADKTRQMRGTLLTFSDGPRACIGRKFAQAEFIACIAALLRDYKVKLAPEEDPKVVEKDLFLKCGGKVSLSPLNHPKLRLEKRR